MPTLVATPGATNANSYVNVADGDTYFDERLQASNWTGESDDEVKERALIMATRRLDQFAYVGIKNATSQALEWPREGAFDRDGEEYATNAIPAFLEHATLELALHYLNQNADSEDGLANDGLERFDRARIGPMDVTINHARSSTQVPDHVLRMIAHVRATTGKFAELERM